MHPILIEFGPIAIRFYGLMYVIAIITGFFLIKKEIKRKGLPLSDDDTWNFILWSVLGGVLGARIYYVAFNMDYYQMFPLEIPAIWHGGLAIHGGIIGGFIFAFFYLKRKKIPFWLMADIVAPSIILGQALGRFGNFLNGDAHGSPTTMSWGIVFPPESIAGREFPNTPLHPTMLYEMTINIAIFLILWFGLRKRPFKNGFIFALYIVMYSFGRFFVEYFRADSLMFGTLKTAQLISIALIAAAGSVIIWKKLYLNEND